jgi:sRNA-binding carbon storage regulator CsrA
MDATRTLVLDVKVGDSVSVDGGRVVMTVQHKSGQQARIAFTAPEAVTIEPVRARPAMEAVAKIS